MTSNYSGAKRTNWGGGGHHLLQPVSFILAPAFIEKRILGLKDAWWMTQQGLEAATQSELSPRFMIVVIYRHQCCHTGPSADCNRCPCPSDRNLIVRRNGTNRRGGVRCNLLRLVAHLFKASYECQGMFRFYGNSVGDALCAVVNRHNVTKHNQWHPGSCSNEVQGRM